MRPAAGRGDQGGRPIDTDEPPAGAASRSVMAAWTARGWARLLTGAGVDVLVAVRRFPGSRDNPDARRETLSPWLPDLGIGCQ